MSSPSATVLFFVLSGASITTLGNFGVWQAVCAYVVLRVVGRSLKGLVSPRFGKDYPASIGGAMLPQAGVALGMTLVAVERMPAIGEEVLPVVVLSTLVFETTGPVVSRAMLSRWGECQV